MDFIFDNCTPSKAYDVAKRWVRADASVTSQITFRQALDGAWAALQEKGYYYVYTNPAGERACSDPLTNTACFNWHQNTNTPGCIVGNILYRSGVPETKLIFNYRESAHSFMDDVTGEALDFLVQLQSTQDKGATWGDAFVSSLKYLQDLYYS